jgi:hypothetical protein
MCPQRPHRLTTRDRAESAFGVKNVRMLSNERSPSVTVRPDDIPVKLRVKGLTFMDASCLPMMALIT